MVIANRGKASKESSSGLLEIMKEVFTGLKDVRGTGDVVFQWSDDTGRKRVARWSTIGTVVMGNWIG